MVQIGCRPPLLNSRNLEYPKTEALPNVAGRDSLALNSLYRGALERCYCGDPLALALSWLDHPFPIHACLGAQRAALTSW